MLSWRLRDLFHWGILQCRNYLTLKQNNRTFFKVFLKIQLKGEAFAFLPWLVSTGPRAPSHWGPQNRPLSPPWVVSYKMQIGWERCFQQCFSEMGEMQAWHFYTWERPMACSILDNPEDFFQTANGWAENRNQMYWQRLSKSKHGAKGVNLPTSPHKHYRQEPLEALGLWYMDPWKKAPPCTFLPTFKAEKKLGTE